MDVLADLRDRVIALEGVRDEYVPRIDANIEALANIRVAMASITEHLESLDSSAETIEEQQCRLRVVVMPLLESLIDALDGRHSSRTT